MGAERKESDEQQMNEAEAEGGEKAKGKGGGGGGEKKKKGGGGEGGGEKKKKDDDGPLTVVLRVDMHCEGCARKVRKSVWGFLGVETVTTDIGSNKLTVVGKVDPWKLRDRVETKNHKRVDLISPKKKDEPKREEKKADEKQKGGDKKCDQKKPKEPVVSTVVLKIRLHCEGCVQRIEKAISKTQGVEKVTIDEEKELVTVEGTMDVKALAPSLKLKLKRDVDVVPPKKDDGGNKKEKGGGGGGKKKEKGVGDGEGGGDKKEKGRNEDGDKKRTNSDDGDKSKDGAGGKKKESGAKVVEASKMEYHGTGGYFPYNGYQLEMVHAPQLFSDENPNACSIM